MTVSASFETKNDGTNTTTTATTTQQIMFDCSTLLSFVSSEEEKHLHSNVDDFESIHYMTNDKGQLVHDHHHHHVGREYSESSTLPILSLAQIYNAENNSSRSSIYLAVARTKHICCCQMFRWDEVSASVVPMVIWRSKDDDYDCGEVIETKSKDDMSSHDFDQNEENKDINEEMVEELITHSAILLSPSNDTHSATESFSSVLAACVILGTSKSRVLVFEIYINVSENKITAAKSYFEPLPFVFPESSETDLTKSLSSERLQNHDSSPSKNYSKGNNSNSNKNDNKEDEKKTDPFYAFHPTGGVSSILPYRHLGSSSTFVWVSYVDGTAVQLADVDFFPSLVPSTSNLDTDGQIVHHPHKARITVAIPYLAQSLPLPGAHTSLLAPIPGCNQNSSVSTNTSPVFQALSYGGDNQYDNSHNPAKGGSSLSFYSSEDHSSRDPTQVSSESELYGIIGGYVFDGTKAILSSVNSVTSTVVGSFMKWGLGYGVSSDDANQGGSTNTAVDIDSSTSTISNADIAHPNKSFLSQTSPHHIIETSRILDAPRRVTSVSVDPNGKLLAVADSLGRVLLINLTNKQIVRMWKGFREANCYWIQQHQVIHENLNNSSSSVNNSNNKNDGYKQVVLYLVLHARQKNVVEIWRMKHGGRVKSIQVCKHAEILQCWEKSSGDNVQSHHLLAKCYVLHSKMDDTNSLNFIEPLVFQDNFLSTSQESLTTASSHHQVVPHAIQKISINSKAMKPSHPAIHLKLLQQILASDTNVPSSPQAVLAALAQITSLADLSEALDLLAVATTIEDEMDVLGSSFHTKAVEYCQNVLQNVEREEGNEGIIYENIHAMRLRKKIDYYSLVIQAFDSLHHYETGMQNDTNWKDDDENDTLAPRTAWSIEAIKWVETHDTIHNNPMKNLSNKEYKRGGELDLIRFSTFAKACVLATRENDHELKVRFSDSTKDRKVVLAHIFRPFLQDIFVYNVVHSIFDAMCISNDLEKLQQYFGEWFLTLPAKESAKASLFGTWCPILRWLQEIIVKSIDVMGAQSIESSYIFLHPLLKICMTSGDLPKAFLLAAVSREAIGLATLQLEAQTYGKILSEEATKPWDELLRKLRICLTVSLRLVDINLGQFPINPVNVEDGNIFSVYEWLAQDEIMISHKQDEIASMEISCQTSTQAFNPFHPEGDSASKWKLLQSGNKAKIINTLKSKALKADYKEGAPLLLYFKNHIHTIYLAAHRALILSGKWGQKPHSLHILKDTVNALRALKQGEDDHRSVVNAVRVEVWQVYIRPVFRAILFGFEDVHELSEDVWIPLCMDGDWLRAFTKVAGEILGLVEQSHGLIQFVEESEKIKVEQDLDDDDNDNDQVRWPPLQKDAILENLIAKCQIVNLDSLKEHKSVVGAVHLVADEIGIVDSCIHEDSQIFLQRSLFSDAPFPSVSNETKVEFINIAIDKKANSNSGQLGCYIDLGEIEILCKTWGISLEEVRSRYLLALYTAGKDAVIADLSASTFQHIHLVTFIDGAFDIICTRLNSTISTLKKTKQLRSLISVLDADTCEWVKDHADRVVKSGRQKLPAGGVEIPSLSATHDLVLKVLQMSSTAGASSSIKQAHSLSILTGTLMKEMEEMGKQTWE